MTMARQSSRFYATGRRKSATARVFIRLGTGDVKINHRTAEDYFPREILRMHFLEPLRTVEHMGNFEESEDGFFIERPDFLSSVAFWYQTGKPKPQPPLPSSD